MLGGSFRVGDDDVPLTPEDLLAVDVDLLAGERALGHHERRLASGLHSRERLVPVALGHPVLEEPGWQFLDLAPAGDGHVEVDVGLLGHDFLHLALRLHLLGGRRLRFLGSFLEGAPCLREEDVVE